MDVAHVDPVAGYRIWSATHDGRTPSTWSPARSRCPTCPRSGRCWPSSRDEELAVAEKAGYFEAAGRYVPHLLSLLRQVEASGGPTAEDPAVLGAVSAPALVLYGSGTMAFYRAGARHVAGHVRDGRMREIPGAGHAAPLTRPEALAEAIIRFFGAG